MRSIDADALKQLIDWNVPSPEWIFYYIDLMPTISDEKLVPQGEWKEWDCPLWQECSICKYRIQYSYSKDCNYCPHCGAKMKG